MITIPKKIIIYLKDKISSEKELLSTIDFTLKDNFVIIDVDIHDLTKLEFKVIPDKVNYWMDQYYDTLNETIERDTELVPIETVQDISCDNDGKYFIN